MACALCGGDHPADMPCPTMVRGVGPGGDQGFMMQAGSAPQLDPLIGTTVGSFRIVRKLGEGGMGAVYQAEQTFIGSKVAVKFLHEHLASNASLVARFYAEARAVNLIGHENIVNIFDMNVIPPRRYYLIMEYLEGDPLAAYAGAPLAADLLIPILAQVCDALEAAHARGVIHRDLKPENLFLVKRTSSLPFVKVLDFGIAKLFSGGPGTEQTSVGAIVGTPEYMAPEQSNGETVDGRADIYALGIIAYRMVTGRLPFASTGLADILLAHRTGTVLPPEQLNPNVSPALSAAILRALAKRREDRFQSALEFKKALEGSLNAGMHAMAMLRDSKTLAPHVHDIAQPAPPRGYGSPPRQMPAQGAPLAPPAAPPAAPRAVAPAPPPVDDAEPLVQFEDELGPAEPLSPPRAPAPKPAASKTPAGTFHGALLIGTQPAADVRCNDVSKAGMFIAVDGALPKAFTRVKVALQFPPPPGSLCEADVVRLVDKAQAMQWGMHPGMAVQFVTPSADFKEQIVRRMQGLPLSAPSANKGAAQDDTVAEKILKRHQPRKGIDPYSLLSLGHDAEFADILQKQREGRRELESLRERQLSAAQKERLEQALEFLASALEPISTPVKRVHYDADRGNFRGVARCMSAGLTVTELEAQRKSYLASHPGAEAKGQVGLVSGRAWETKGDDQEALKEYERALAVDPLNLQLQQRYWSIKRKPA